MGVSSGVGVGVGVSSKVGVGVGVSSGVGVGVSSGVGVGVGVFSKVGVGVGVSSPKSSIKSPSSWNLSAKGKLSIQFFFSVTLLRESFFHPP